MWNFAWRDPIKFTLTVLVIAATCVIFCGTGIEELGFAAAAFSGGEAVTGTAWAGQAAGPWFVLFYGMLSGDQADPGPITPYVPAAKPAPAP
jgi:hypothetical protein